MAQAFTQRLGFFLREFWWFGIRQAQACLYAGAMLAGILATKYGWNREWALARYDFLVFYALLIQIVFIFLKLETWEEVKVIFVFHIVGTIMEIFKTHVGSWIYPEENILRIGGVPLFSGFMYSAIGSYIARVWRIFAFKFDHFPSRKGMVLLSVLIYINFFTHHYTYDIRYFLFAFSIWLFYRTRIYYRPRTTYYWMPLLMSAVLTATFIWFAENIGTFTATWLYPNQNNGWQLVSLAKLGSWYLLMIISFVLVSVLHKDKVDDQ